MIKQSIQKKKKVTIVNIYPPNIVVVQSLNHVQLFEIPWTVVQRFPCPSLSPRVFSDWDSCPLMPSNHLIFCHPLLLLPSIFTRIRVFSNDSALRIRWPKYWSFSFSISPSNEYSGLISLRIDWFDLLIVQGTVKSLYSTIPWKHQVFGVQPSLWSNSHIHTWLLEKP